jgi:O-antigen/teichoic acid export membrane protein
MFGHFFPSFETRGGMTRSGAHLFAWQPIWRMVKLVCGAIAAAGLTFLVQLLLSRMLDVSSYGRLVAMLAVANILATLASWGVSWMWIQLYGSDGWRAQRWISVSLRMMGLSSFAASALMVVYVLATEPAPFADSILVAAAMTVIMLGQSQIETVTTRLQLEERYDLLTGWQLFTPGGRALVVAAVLAAGSGYHDLASVLLGFAIVGTGVGVFFILSVEQLRHGRIRLAGHGAAPTVPVDSPPPQLRHVFPEALPYVLQTIFFLVGSQGVVAIVERLLGPYEAGIYNVAFVLLSAAYLIPTVVYTKYLGSKLFRWWAHDRRMFNAAFHVGVAAQLVLGLLCMAIVMVASSLLVSFLFGPRYGEAAQVLRILALAIPIRFVLISYDAAFYSRQHMLRKVGYWGMAMTIGVVLNILLTPSFGLNGAAASVVVADLLLLLFLAWGAGRHIDGIAAWSSFRPSTLRQSLDYIGNSREASR